MVIAFKKIDHVQLVAPIGTEQKVRGFFSQLLGFKEIEKPEKLQHSTSIWFVAGEVYLHVGFVQSFAPAAKAHPAFEVESLLQVKAHLTSEKISYQEDNRVTGVDRLFIEDPFGNRIELLERLNK